MLESLKGIRGNPIFRETFNSFNAISNNGGDQTDLSLDKGVGTFDGSTSQIEYSKKDLNFTNATFSVRAKIKLDDGQPSSVNNIVTKYNTTGNQRSWRFYVGSSGTLYFQNSDDGIASSSVGTDAAVFTDGAQDWADVVLSVSSGTPSFYVDGVVKASTGTAKTSQYTSNADVLIGNRAGVSEYIEGDIELVELYDYALSANEVSLLYTKQLNHTPADFATPLLSYDFKKDKSAYNSVEFGSELVTNGGMELNSDWSVYNNPTSQAQSNEQANSGTYSWKIVSPGGSRGINQLVTGLVAGTNLKLIAYYYSVTGGQAYIRTFNGSDNTTLITTSSSSLTANDVWTKYEVNLEVPAGETSIYIRLTDFGTPGTYYYDDVSLKADNNYGQSLTDCTFAKQGLIANGSTTKLDTGSTVDLTGDITFEVIINPVSYGEGGFGRILFNGDDTLEMGIDDATIWFQSETSAAVRSAADSILINDKSKHCVITRASDGTTNFYINGELSGTANQDSGTPEAGTTNIFIGNKADGTRTFDGAIKVVNVSSGIATVRQIEHRYNYWVNRGYITR